ncbi:MAG TPA: CBS domain-containing protein [Pyrinomonadaceae bacterium]|nr:CBS domain-containing protein [Pyrinomonadaceae bacterium]
MCLIEDQPKILTSWSCTRPQGISPGLWTTVSASVKNSGRHPAIAVKEEVTGLVTPNEVRGIARERWPYITVFDVMRHFERLKTVTPETPVSEALEIIGRDNINQLPALVNGRLAGIKWSNTEQEFISGWRIIEKVN